MTPAEIALVLAGGLAVTYSARLSFLLAPGLDRMPGTFRRGLRLVAPAVLAAILALQVVGGDGAGVPVARPVALLIAALLAWRSRNTWLTIGAGMVALWVLQALLS